MKLGSLLLLLLLTAAVSGCNGSIATHERGAGGTVHPVAEVRVGLTEWTIIAGARLLSPGPVAVTVTNAGTTAHDLLVRGPGVQAHTRELRPGGRQVLRFRAPAGRTLHLSCTLPGHHEAGMHATVEVAERSTPAGEHRTGASDHRSERSGSEVTPP